MDCWLEQKNIAIVERCLEVGSSRGLTVILFLFFGFNPYPVLIFIHFDFVKDHWILLWKQYYINIVYIYIYIYIYRKVRLMKRTHDSLLLRVSCLRTHQTECVSTNSE